MIGNRLVFALVAILTLALASGVLTSYLFSRPAIPDSFQLEFNKTGGIAGVNDSLIIRNDGLATLTSKYGTSFNRTVGPVEFSQLKEVISSNLDNISPKTFHARVGAADYFAYRLLVSNATKTTEVAWVDQWAVNGTFPDALRATHSEIQKLVTDLSARDTFVNTNLVEAGGLRMTILTDSSRYRLGDRVNIVAILENAGPSEVTFTSPSPCSPDVSVVAANESMTQDIAMNEGEVVCVQVLQPRTLQPNTYVVQSGSWDLTVNQGGNRIPASPGRYTISAVFPFATFEKQLVSSSVEISVATSAG